MGYIIAMNKPMTAFRFARMHNVPIKYYTAYAHNEAHRELALYASYADINDASLSYNNFTGDMAIGVAVHTSQLIKECSIWHELGHYMDVKELGVDKVIKLPVLLMEARASKIAITLMKKYGRYREANKIDLLAAYDTHKQGETTAQSYRHLIEDI